MRIFSHHVFFRNYFIFFWMSFNSSAGSWLEGSMDNTPFLSAVSGPNEDGSDTERSPTEQQFEDNILDFIPKGLGDITDYFDHMLFIENMESKVDVSEGCLGLQEMEKFRNLAGEDVYRFPTTSRDKAISFYMQNTHGYAMENLATSGIVSVVSTRCYSCHKIRPDMRICEGCEHVSFCTDFCLFRSFHNCAYISEKKKEFFLQLETAERLGLGVTTLTNCTMLF